MTTEARIIAPDHPENPFPGTYGVAVTHKGQIFIGSGGSPDEALGAALDAAIVAATAAPTPETERARIQRIARATGLAVMPATVLHVLLDARSGLVTRDHMAQRLWDLTATRQDNLTINSHIKRVRAGLRAVGHPVAITTMNGMGWSVEVLGRLPY